MASKIYLDNNASTFVDYRVAEFISHALYHPRGNPSSVHNFGQKARNELNTARTVIASFLKIRPSELIFTSGGTEGVNTVIRGLTAQKRSGHLITSVAEHSSVYATIKDMQAHGFDTTFLPTGEWGAVSPDAVRAAIRPDTLLIALMSVNNETGVKTDIETIAALAEAQRIPFFVDGVAQMGKEIFSICPGVSAMCFSGHKFHAPQGAGLLFLRSGLKLRPLITGGGHEAGRRAGTENMLGILGMAKGIELLSEELPAASEKMAALRDKFESILQSHLPDVYINGKGPRIANVSNLAFASVDGEALLMALDAAGIAASHGSACSSGAREPSRVLLGMGIPMPLVSSSLRFSISRFTTEQEINEACQIIIKLVHAMRVNHLK